jgi:hypothetical protein
VDSFLRLCIRNLLFGRQNPDRMSKLSPSLLGRYFQDASQLEEDYNLEPVAFLGLDDVGMAITSESFSSRLASRDKSDATWRVDNMRTLLSMCEI